MLAETLIKLLIVSIAMLGLVRLVVILFIGDAQDDLAVWRFIHAAKRAWNRNL